MKVKRLKIGKFIKYKKYKNIIYRWQYNSYKYTTDSS